MRMTMQDMIEIAGTHRDFEINIAQAESYFEEIFNKIQKRESISHDEEEYLEKFFKHIYPRIGGNLYPYPRYNEKLREVYQIANDYYLTNLNKNTPGSITFLWYYQMTLMSKENDLKPRLTVGHKRFEEEKNVRAFYVQERTGIGDYPALYFNPLCINSCLEDKQNIIGLLVTSFHELEHACQTEMIESEKLDNPQALIWAKEKLVRSTVLGNAYYTLNYQNIFAERDARYYSNVRANKMLEGKGFIITGFEDDAYNLDVQQKLDADSAQVLAIDLLDALTTKAIKENPKLLDRFLVLKNIYNMDGSKKTLAQIESELRTRFEAEAQKDSSINVEEKTINLLKGICETDNDLQFQYLCQEASNFYSDNKNDEFNTTVSTIQKLLEIRDMSFDEFEQKIEGRIKNLRTQMYIILHPEQGNKFDKTAYDKLDKELQSTRALLESAIEYNPKFKAEHNDKVMKTNIKRNLSLKIRREIGDKYKYYATDKGYLQAIPMTTEEENERFRQEIQSLLDANTRDGVLDSAQFEQDVHDLNTYYGINR